MSTTPKDQRSLHDARQAPASEEVWRLREIATDRIQSCELRDDTKAGGGWEVQILVNGEPLFSRHCGDEWTAWFLAQAIKRDSTRGGEWVEDDNRPCGSA